MEKEKLATLNNISKTKAWRMIEKYRTHYMGSECDGAESLTNGVWFPISEVETWIKDVKDAGCSGMRIYFATYLDKEDHNHRTTGAKLNYAHRNTVVLIATKLDGTKERHYYKTTSASKMEDPLNKGELCPEQCSEEDD